MPEVDTIAFVAFITARPPEHLTMNDPEVNWPRIKYSTKHGRAYLINSIGFAYTATKKRTHATDWHCSVRNSAITCTARVKEQDVFFSWCNWTFTSTNSRHHWSCSGQSQINARGPATHVYSMLPNCGISTPRTPVSRGSMPITAEAYGFSSSSKQTNSQRQFIRPKHPSSLDFELNEPAIPDGLLIADIDVGTAPNMRQHLIVASTRQLELLALVKYVLVCWWNISPGSSAVYPIIFHLRWHKRLNSGAKSQQHLYKLIQVLHTEAMHLLQYPSTLNFQWCDLAILLPKIQ